MTKPIVREMIREAVDALGGKAKNVDVRDWVLRKYPGTNPLTVAAQIIVATVNHDSRVHYPQNQKARRADSENDFLYRPQKGWIEKYDSEKHGHWEIRETESGQLIVQQVDLPLPRPTDGPDDREFAEEKHLRDYLAVNPHLIEEGLQLYADEEGQNGVEYPIPVGRIDLLAVDKDGGLVVVELKLSKGPDAAAGQMMRYRGWVKKHLANGKPVRCYVIARHITDRLRYAFHDVSGVHLKEYELSFRLKSVDPA